MADSSDLTVAEEQHSFWASHEKYPLKIMREVLESDADYEFRILKVPEISRQPSADYTPVGWRFGLHNRDENVDMSDLESAKRALVVLFGLDHESEWKEFCDAVVPDPKAISMIYGLHKEVIDLLGSRIKHVLAYDALFLAVWMAMMESNPLHNKLITRKLEASSGWSYFRSTYMRTLKSGHVDLCIFENQIPFDLIKRAINHVLWLTNSREENIEGHAHTPNLVGQMRAARSDMESWMRTAVFEGMRVFMVITDDFYGDMNANERLSESHHILAAAHKVICGVNGMRRMSNDDQEDYIHVPSATRLKDCGIRIKAVTGPLSVMSYDKEKMYLYIPKINIYDRAIPLVRNMGRYEDDHEYGLCMFHDYIFLMLDLIQTPLDFNHLVKCGVVANGCGNKAFDLWRALDDGFDFIPSSEEHNEMKRDINERCKLRRHRLWNEFKTLFLSRPWLTLSAVAITLVTLATLIQTYTAITSSNGMKPQFTP